MAVFSRRLSRIAVKPHPIEVYWSHVLLDSSKYKHSKTVIVRSVILFIRWEKSNAVMISHQVRRLHRRKSARLLSLRAAESFNRTSKNIHLYLYARVVGGRRYYSGLFSVFARRKYRYSIFQPENTRRRFFIFYAYISKVVYRFQRRSIVTRVYPPSDSFSRRHGGGEINGRPRHF